MDNLEQILVALFRRVSARMVLDGNLRADNLERDTFASIAYAYLRQYSESELDNMWRYYKDTFETDRMNAGRGGRYFSDGIRVFDALFHYADRMLVEQDNELLCRYERLMQWRMLTFEISEDLLAAAYFAKLRQPMEMEERGYDWKIVLGHNNFQLNAIIDRGISENHFHLYGSSPMFHISWVSLMNNVQDKAIVQNLLAYDYNRRNGNIRYNAFYKEDSLQLQLYQAAWIRVFFYAILTGTPVQLRSRKESRESCSAQEAESEDVNRKGKQGNGSVQGRESGSTKGSPFKTDNSYTRRTAVGVTWKKELLDDILEMLCDEYSLRENVAELQSLIEELRNPFFSIQSKEYEDYAFGAVDTDRVKSNLFSGERWLMYSCLHEIRKDCFNDQLVNLFYVYVLIKENIRAELIQTNGGVGFRNFQTYEKRKLQLVHSAAYRNEFVRSAVRENMLSPHIESLELRISPGDSAASNAQYIMELDHLIGEPKSKYFYVIHFIKQPDENGLSDDCIEYRHFNLRRKIRRETDAIIKMREIYPKTASRLLGIDAASNEIGCRPEVFAYEFRRLRNHTKVLETDESVGLLPREDEVHHCGSEAHYFNDAGCFKVPQLRVTYHVGEDFLDVVDGLRAIDEAINFLNMDCGDRLGHAIALGQNVDEWYQSKDYRILIPQQDYLDNIVWLYNRLIDFKIPGMDSIKNYIERKYVFYFDKIYGKNINYEMVDRILADAKDAYDDAGYPSTFHNDRYQFGIHQYYNAWKLRGDDPQLYAYGYFDYHNDGTQEQYHRVNHRFPREFEIRRRPEVFLLNYYYQYDLNVRREGNKRIEVKVKPDYVEAVRLVQKEMQRLVGRKGIMVETNPSSNYKIGTFRDYAKHPIFNLYNSGLTYDADQLAECPQLSVSINTDDKGVFSTCLENEYALLAKALEDQVDENGKQLYTKAMVYNWINAVRMMGNEQSFKRRESV